MMTCAGLLAVATVIFLIGILVAFAWITVALGVILAAVVLGLAAIIYSWRNIYPWLVRMGRWAARPLNIIFLFILVVVTDFALKWAVGQGFISLPIITLPIIGIDFTIIGLILLLLALFLLLLAIVVWLVRLWRYGWPRVRNVFWDLVFRFVAMVWKILVGIPLGIVWFFYHPPLRWLVAGLLFYGRGIARGVGWLLCHPPLQQIARAVLFVMRLIARFIGWLLFNAPIIWVAGAAVFLLRLVAHIISTIIDRIWATEFVKGVRQALRRGLTVERDSYQDYKYAHDDSRAAA